MLDNLMTRINNALKHRIAEKMFAENIFGNMYRFTVRAAQDFLEKMEYSADMYSLDAFIHYYQVEVSKCDTDIEELYTQIDEYEELLDTARNCNHNLHERIGEFASQEQIGAVREHIRSWTKAELQANYLQLRLNAQADRAIRDDYSRQIRILQDRIELIISRNRMEVARKERRIQFLQNRIEFSSASGYMPPYKFDDDCYLEEVVNIFDVVQSDNELLQPTSIFIAKNWLHKAMLTSPSRFHTYAVGLACPLACSLGTQFCEESSGCLPTWIGVETETSQVA